MRVVAQDDVRSTINQGNEQSIVVVATVEQDDVSFA